MKRFVLGVLASVVSLLGGNAEAGTIPGSFNAPNFAGQSFSDPFVTFSDFNLTGSTPGRNGDNIAISFDSEYSVGGYVIRGYSITYTYSGGMNTSSNTILDFHLAANAAWKIRRFNTNGLMSGASSFTARGTSVGDPSNESYGPVVNGTFADYTTDDSAGSFQNDFSWTITAGAVQSFTTYVEIQRLDGSVVPEPSSIAIFTLGAAGFVVRRFRRK